jgi:hypothetical protein
MHPIERVPQQSLELDDATGEVDQDRGQSGLSFQGGDVPDGGGGGAPEVVRGDPGTDRSATTRPRAGLSDRVVGEESDGPTCRTGMARPEGQNPGMGRGLGDQQWCFFTTPGMT